MVLTMHDLKKDFVDQGYEWNILENVVTGEKVAKIQLIKGVHIVVFEIIDYSGDMKLKLIWSDIAF